MTTPMQCVLGMQCNNFVIMAADKTNSQSVIIMDQAAEKIKEVSEHMLLSVVGEAGDVAQLVNYVSGNLELYRMRHKYRLGTGAVVHFVRRTVVEALFGGRALILSMLLGGVDSAGASLHIMDFLGATVKVWYGVQGIGAVLCTSILHRNHRPNLTLYEAYEVLKKCVREMRTRFVFNLPIFSVKAVTRGGVIVLPDIVASTLD